LNQAAAGIASSASSAVARLLADPILTQSRFQRRLRMLRIAAAVPERIARAAIRIHNTPWLGPWRKLYLKLTAPQAVSVTK